MTTLNSRGWTINGHTVTYPETTNGGISNGKMFLDAVNYLLLTTESPYQKYLEYYNTHPSTTRWLSENKQDFRASGRKNYRGVAFGLWLDNNTSNDEKIRCMETFCHAFGYEYGSDVTINWSSEKSEPIETQDVIIASSRTSYRDGSDNYNENGRLIVRQWGSEMRISEDRIPYLKWLALNRVDHPSGKQTIDVLVPIKIIKGSTGYGLLLDLEKQIPLNLPGIKQLQLWTYASLSELLSK